MNFIQEFLKSINIGEFQQIPLYVVGFAIVFAVLFGLYLIAIKVIKKLHRKSEGDFFFNVIQKLKFPSLLLIFLVSMIAPMAALNPESELIGMIDKLLVLLAIAAGAWALIRGVGLFKNYVLSRYDPESDNNLKARKVYTQIKLIERVSIAVIIVVAIGLGLTTFDGIRKIGAGLLASAGIAGVILGLAAQKILGAILAGLQIAITQPIRLDDVVIVEGEWGKIEEINLTYVVVRIWDERRLVVPTTYFMEQPFQNWTRESSDLLGTIYVYTDYKYPVEELRAELEKICEQSEDWDRKVCVTQVTGATESSMEIRALVGASDSSKLWSLRVFVREKLIEFVKNSRPEFLPRTRVELEK